MHSIDQELHSNNVHIWVKPIDVLSENIDTYYSILSADEKMRAERFYFLKDRMAFTVTRGYLRHLMSSYLEEKAHHIVLKYNTYGKPYLPYKQHNDNSQIKFNVSHAGNFLAIAITRGIEVGIDIEKINNEIAYNDIAQNFFSNTEFNEITSLPKSQQRKYFFQCWTRKEAYIKGHGMGLSMSLKSFDVSASNKQQPILLATRHDRSAIDQWDIHHLNMPEAYTGAISTNHKSCDITLIL